MDASQINSLTSLFTHVHFRFKGMVWFDLFLFYPFYRINVFCIYMYTCMLIVNRSTNKRSVACDLGLHCLPRPQTLIHYTLTS